MNKRIIYQNDNGSISVIIPVDCGLTVEEIADNDVPAGKAYEIVDVADIPSDRTFRNAWIFSVDRTVGIDMLKAAEIRKDQLRAERVSLFAALDVEYIGAMEAENQEKQREIIERKQYLRDLPQDIRFVAAQTPGDLLAIKIDRSGIEATPDKEPTAG